MDKRDTLSAWVEKKPTVTFFQIINFFFFFFSGNRQRASLPPDGTTFLHLSLGELQKKTIPSYSYWNFQVRNFHSRQFAYYSLFCLFRQDVYLEVSNLSYHCSSTKKSLPTWRWISCFPAAPRWVYTLAKTPFPRWHSMTFEMFLVDTGTAWLQLQLKLPHVTPDPL